jgi:Flp pilus assembly protein TadG
MLRLPPACRRRRGVAGVEFALVAPILLTLVIGVFDISKAMILRQQVLNAAHAISLAASLLAAQNPTTQGTTVASANGSSTVTESSTGTTTLTYTQVQAVESDILAQIPWLRSGVERGTFFVTLTGIQFSALPSASCQPYSTCTLWIPFVSWSVPYMQTPPYGTLKQVRRACGGAIAGVLNIYSQQNVALTSANLMSTLRVGGITYPDPILVADVSYTYTPTFLRFITGPVTFVASAYWPVRIVPYNSTSTPGGGQGSQLTQYDLTQYDTASHCAGFG